MWWMLAAEGDAVDLAADVGAVNLTGYLDALKETLGALVLAALGCYFVFKVLKLALAWASASGGELPPAGDGYSAAEWEEHDRRQAAEFEEHLRAKGAW